MNAVADILIIAFVFATLAQAWSWLGAYARIVSFGHAVFFGIGAYAVAVSNMRGGSPWYGALGGGLFAVLVATMCGLLLLRGRGYLFTALTLAAGIAAEPFAAARHWLGPDNAFAFPIRRGFLNLQFDERWPYVLLALAVFGVTQALTVGLRSTRTGYYLHALRANPAAARATGIAARPPRLLVLAVSAFVTSVAGSFFAEYTLGVDPHRVFALGLSFDIALIGVVAGPRFLWGPPLAALAYVLLAKAVPLHPPGLPGAIILTFEAAVVVLIAWLRPDGLAGASVHLPRRGIARSTA